MAATLQFASKKETIATLQNWQKALDFHPEWAKQYLKDHGNPLIPWPGPKEAVGSFNLSFDTNFGGENLPNVIEAKQLEGLVAAFDAHIAECRAAHEAAIQKSQKYLELLKKQVARNGGNPDAVVNPAEDPVILQKVDARAQEPIARVLSGDIPAEQKLEYFTKIATPRTIPEVEVVSEQLAKSSLLLTALGGPAPKDSRASFKDIAVTATQGAAAPLLDAVTAPLPNVRTGVINHVLIDSFQNTINKTGEDMVRQPWFDRFQRDSHQIMAQGSSLSGVGTVAGDVIGGIFRGAPDETFETFRDLYRINAIQDRPASGSGPRRTAGAMQSRPVANLNQLRMARVMSILRDAPSETVVAYVEYYRVSLAQGAPPLSFSQFRMSNAGTGSSLIRAGINMEMRKAGGSALKSFAARIGLDALIPGPGWVKALFDVGGFLLGKVSGWFKGFSGMIPGFSKEDWWIVAIVSGPILLIILVTHFGQINYDNSLSSHLAMGGGSPPGGHGTGEGAGGLPPYTGAPSIPSDITGCPTKNAYELTQCPNGTYSHHNIMCAYDLGMNDGTPILAAHDGVIAVTTPTKQSYGYGNMIEIKGVTPGGQTYYTLYGHLASFSVKPGDQVRAGQIIGYSDNTGNSSGSHLHFEYRSSTNAMVPDCGIRFLSAGCVTNPGYCNLQ